MPGTWRSRRFGAGHLRFCDPDDTIGISDPIWSGGRGVVAVGCDPRLPWQTAKEHGKQTVFPPDFESFMSYCREEEVLVQPTQWISAYRWGEMFSVFPTARRAGPRQAPRRTFSTSQDGCPERRRHAGSGADPVGLLGRGDQPGDYVLELQDGTGTVLSATSFFAAFTDVEGQRLDRVTFDLRLPFDPAVCRIVLKRGGQVLDTIAASANPPALTVTTPDGGERRAGGFPGGFSPGLAGCL